MTGHRLNGKPLLAVLLMLILAQAVSAGPLRNAEDPDPGAPDTLDVYLLIIGRGLPMYSWWGHIGIVIRENATGVEFLYDYGNFSFSADDFFANFAMGRLWFQMMRMFASSYYEYIGDSDRDLRLHRLNLPAGKERALKAYLDWNNRPENRLYLYHYYNDNCSTRIRDLFDDLVGGQLEEASAIPSGLTLRQLSRKYSRFYPLGDWIIAYLLAGSCDRPVTLWEAMFLPDYLERFVLDFHYLDSKGRRVPLVAESTAPMVSQTLAPIPPGPDAPVWYRGLLFGLLWALPGLVLGLFRRAAVLHDLYRLLTGLLPALPGTILFFMMFFSNHDVTYGNWNILVASPLGFAVVPLTLWLWHDKKKRPGLEGYSRRPERALCLFFLVQGALSLAALLLARIPGAQQNNLMIVLTFLPGYLAGGVRGAVLSGFLSIREVSPRPDPSVPDPR